MQRYFIPSENWKEDNVIITGDDAHHIIRVMRLKAGDLIIGNHSDGHAAICRLEDYADELNKVFAVVEEWLGQSVEMPVHVTIAQGLPKGDKMDLVLQKGTELGASGFIPFQAERSVVKWDNKKAEKKQIRFQKIVKEASEQCHRNKIPAILPTMDLNLLLEESVNYDIKVFPYEEEAKGPSHQSISSIIRALKGNERILVCIGPEGGFSEQEAQQLKKNNFLPVRLGPRILRTETAALYVLASISYHLEELGG